MSDKPTQDNKSLQHVAEAIERRAHHEVYDIWMRKYEKVISDLSHEMGHTTHEWESITRNAWEKNMTQRKIEEISREIVNSVSLSKE